MAEESVRERYNARDPRPFHNGKLPDFLRQEFSSIQRGIPWPATTIDLRDAAEPGRDFATAIQKAHNALPDSGGIIRLPTMKAAWLLDGTGATLASPKRGLNITKNNVWIVGDGDTPIHMANWDQTDAAGAGADTAGQDVFTLFRFTSGVVGGGVWGFYVTGESDDSALSVGEPRAKVVGCDGADHIRIQDVRGVDIVGNVLNARGDNAGAGASGNCRDIVALNVFAENCAENGINYMGGTYDCKVLGGAADDCEFQGLETGTYGLEVIGFRATGNKNGISHVGRHGKFIGCQLNGNTITGFNFQFNSATFDAAFNSLLACHIYENASVGVLANTDSHDNELDGCHVWDNGPTGNPPAGTGEGIKLSTDCERYTIHGGHIYDTGAARQRYAINVVDSHSHFIHGVRTYGNLTWSLLVQSTSDGLTFRDNEFEEALVSISSSATTVRQTNNRGFAQTNPAQLTANQNDYAPSNQWAETWRLTSDASRNITGIAGGLQDRRIRIVNAGAQNIVLQNQNAGSSAVTRIITGTAADITVAPDDVAQLWYDDATDRWRVTSHY
jgi:hypothetical protein